MRQYADKILMKHDYDWFMDTLKQVCYDCFELLPEDDEGTKPTGEDEEDGANATKPDDKPLEEQPAYRRQDQISHHPSTKSGKSSRKVEDSERVWPITIPDQDLWYSTLNMEVDGYYCEFKNLAGQNLPISEVINKKIGD